MKPAPGDIVKFTNRFINNSPLIWVPALKDIELEVIKVKLISLFPKVFTTFIMVNKVMYKVNINETGHFVDTSGNVGNDIVFEFAEEDEEEELTPVNNNLNPTPLPTWIPNISANKPSKPATKDEANAICPQCGAPAVDLLFSIKCTNPSCSNY